MNLIGTALYIQVPGFALAIDSLDGRLLTWKIHVSAHRAHRERYLPTAVGTRLQRRDATRSIGPRSRFRSNGSRRYDVGLITQRSSSTPRPSILEARSTIEKGPFSESTVCVCVCVITARHRRVTSMKLLNSSTPQLLKLVWSGRYI